MNDKKNEPQIILGGLVSDKRGSVRFVNDFSFKTIRRFYQVQNKNNSLIRAWHGHMKEEKYVYVAKGKALVCAVHLTESKNPSPNENVFRFILDAKTPSLLYIPSQFANGFKTLEDGTVVIFFSSFTVDQSLHDDHRYPVSYFKTKWEEDK